MNKSVKSDFGAEIRSLRKNAGLTIEELAFRAGVHYNYLGDVERGTRNASLENIAKIAAGLSIPLSRLFPNNKKPLDGRQGECEAHLRQLAALMRKNTQDDRELIIEQARHLSRLLASRY